MQTVTWVFLRMAEKQTHVNPVTFVLCLMNLDPVNIIHGAEPGWLHPLPASPKVTAAELTVVSWPLTFNRSMMNIMQPYNTFFIFAALTFLISVQSHFRNPLAKTTVKTKMSLQNGRNRNQVWKWSITKHIPAVNYWIHRKGLLSSAFWKKG